MLICIDPGLSGAIAWQDDERRIWVDPMPDTMGEIYETIWETWNNYSIPQKTIIAVIEKVGGYMPGNSGPASVKFARHIGHLEMALYACGISTEQVAPQTWMKSLGVPKLEKSDRKRWIKDAMQRRFPAIKVTLQNADALGIMLWALKEKP